MSRIEIAIMAANEAGAIVKKGFESLNKDIDSKRDSNDLVTKYDLKAQEIIISQIKTFFPDDAIIAEEKEYNKTKTKTGWVIDPIDGTNPFSRGIPTFAVVIGYMENYEAQFCIVYNPATEEFFVAQKGKGVTLNDERITIASRPFENQLLSLEGFGRSSASHMRYLLRTDIYNVIGRSSGAFSTMMVTSGQSDAYVVKTPHIWDRIHYILLVEAGAKVTNFKGEPYTVDQHDYVAAHPDHHQRYVEKVQAAVKELDSE